MPDRPWFWLARVGGWFGWRWAVYNPGVIRAYRHYAAANAPLFADAVLALFPDIATLADVGCGTGEYVAAFCARGVRAIGCEHGARPRALARQLGVEALPFDLAGECQPLPGAPFDCVISIEVAEHLAPHLADEFVRFLTRTSHLVVMTAAQPGQLGSIGHLNEQPKAYWIERFARHAFDFDASSAQRLESSCTAQAAADFLCRNMMVFRGPRVVTTCPPAGTSAGRS